MPSNSRAWCPRSIDRASGQNLKGSRTGPRDCARSAKRGACAAIAALSAYETANDADTLDLKSPTKVAPLKLLLRRARSDEFLLPPEQLPATARQIEAVLRLAAYRNDVLHGGAGDRAASIVGDANTCVILIRHFLEGAPAFDPSDYAVHCALVSDELTAIEAALRQLG